MWVCLYDAFLSIVYKDCRPDELLVRARRPGDIEKIFPNATVTKYDKSDYLFRAVIKRVDVIAALTVEVEDIEYPNFKDAVGDKPLHDAYLGVWYKMAQLQPTAPYSGYRGKKRYDPHLALPPLAAKPGKGSRPKNSKASKRR